MYEVSQVISGTMVYVCWADKEQLPYIWILKFIEQTATNMLAITNLAICVNLALIVSVRVDIDTDLSNIANAIPLVSWDLRMTCIAICVPVRQKGMEMMWVIDWS